MPLFHDTRFPLAYLTRNLKRHILFKSVFSTAYLLLYVCKRNKPTILCNRKEKQYAFIIYLILTPILCLLGMLMLEHLERKIKTALAKRAKAVSKHSCSVEKSPSPTTKHAKRSESEYFLLSLARSAHQL